jgi:hypothetical protein
MAAACGQPTGSGPRPPASSLKEGLTIFDAIPDYGVNAAYVKNGKVIYIETRIGPATLEFFRLDDPNTPLHEVDVRFVDEYGNTFSAQRGGDEFIDPTWTMNQVHPVSAAERDLQFKMANQAGSALTAQLPVSMSEHATPALNISRLIPSESPQMIARAQELAAQASSEGTYTEYWWESDMYYKTVAIIGNHSAAYAFDYNYGTGSWDWSMNTCNHGTCAGSMSYYCYTGSRGHYSPFQSTFTGDTTQNTSSGNNGACCTQYNWNPGGGQHNSNDDGFYEMYQAKYGRFGGGCGDGANHSDSCGNTYSCSSGSGNGEFTRPCCL